MVRTLYYEGYGIFDDEDVYEMVVDWNFRHLAEIADRIEAEGNMGPYDEPMLRLMRAYAAGDDAGRDAAIEEMSKTTPCARTDWKRFIGVHIASDNEKLPYPIKVVDRKTPIAYEKLNPSIICQ